MKFAHMSEIKKINVGYGWQLIRKQEKLSVFMPAAGAKKEQKDFGIRSRRNIVNVLLFIQIFGRHMPEFFLQNVTAVQQKTAEKQVISNGLTIRCAREFPDLCEKHFPFQKKLKII